MGVVAVRQRGEGTKARPSAACKRAAWRAETSARAVVPGLAAVCLCLPALPAACVRHASKIKHAARTQKAAAAAQPSAPLVYLLPTAPSLHHKRCESPMSDEA